MGKKDKNKKKGAGAAKTAEKTDKKLRAKMKKATGEEDIEEVVRAIEEEERRRSEVKEVPAEAPSHRANLSLTPHPEGNPELVLFGGEFHDGRRTTIFADLLVYNAKRRSWTQVKSPAGPPPRCSHQAVATAGGGGGGGGEGARLWVFGGEYASPSETQFHHYKDLWCFHFGTRRWEKVSAPGGPSSRSGHRMALVRRHLVVFGGFHDNNRECKYFNDVHAFDIDNMKWKKPEIVGAAPAPRSGCVLFPLADGRGVAVFGGYCKEKGKKDAEKGKTLADMFILTPDKNDPTMTKWRWQTVKQVGSKPSLRTGMSVTVAPNGKVFVFGGVQDVKEDDEELEGSFFNDLYSVSVEGEKATWNQIELKGRREEGEKRSRRRQKGDRKEGEGEDSSGEEGEGGVQEQMDGLQLKEGEATTVTVESGAFTVTSTVGGSDAANGEGQLGGASAAAAAGSSRKTAVNAPSPRFGAAMAIKQGTLYLFGGSVEDGDVTYTLKDLYSIDIHKFDEWTTLIESDIKSMEWYDSETDEEDEEDDSDEDEDEESMDEN